MKNFFTTVFLILVVGVAGIVLAKDVILKVVMEQAVSGLTGFPTKVGSIKYDLPSTILIKDLEIRNPAGFEEKVFASIPEIYVSLVLPEVLAGKRIHLPEVRLNIQEIHLEKNAQGVSNMELLSSVGAKPGQKKPVTPAEPQPKKAPGKPPMPFLLEKLVLTIHKVSYQDRSGIIGRAPVHKLATDLNVEKETFSNIDDPLTLVNLVLMKIIRGTAFGNLLKIDPTQLLGSDLSGTLRSGQAFVGKQAAELSKEMDNVTGQATGLLNQKGVQNSLDEAQNVLGEGAATARKKFSGLMGKMKSLAPSETGDVKQ